jgi:pyruvate/2-oxoglutarate/acetoin dehydrogenase E1 component
MLTYHRWFGRTLNIAVVGRSQPIVRAGLFSNTIVFSDPVVELTFSRLYAGAMSDMAAKFRLPLPENERNAADPNVRAEFA